MRFSPDQAWNGYGCTACGTCRTVCPSGALETTEKGSPKRFLSTCIGCGHCGVYCPQNCFSLESRAESTVGSEALLGHVTARRSCRFFKPYSLSRDDIEALLSVVGYSPTGKNAGGLTVRVYNGREAVENLLENLLRVVRVLCRTGLPQLGARMSGMSDALRRLRSGEDILFREAPAVLFFHVDRGNAMWKTDGVIAATHVMVNAGTIGISTLWNGFAEVFYPFVRGWHTEETRGTRLAAVLCAGYPSMNPLWKLPPRDFSTTLTDLV